MSQPAYPYQPPAATPAPVQPVASRSAGVFARLALTLLGAAITILGSFMDWVRGVPGVDVSWRAFWQTTFSTRTATFVETVGFVIVVIGLLGIVGLAPRSGWLTRFAGALGVVAFVLFAIELVRMTGNQSLGSGAWITLIGSVVMLVAGFLGRRIVGVAPVRSVGPVAPAA